MYVIQVFIANLAQELDTEDRQGSSVPAEPPAPGNIPKRSGAQSEHRSCVLILGLFRFFITIKLEKLEHDLPTEDSRASKEEASKPKFGAQERHLEDSAFKML